MKCVLFVFVLLAGVFAQAEFKAIKVAYMYANTPNEVNDLEKMYPALLSSIPASDRPNVISAQLVFKEYAWYGTSSCAAGDSRLHRSHQSLAAYCVSSSGGGTRCSSSVEIMFPEDDPCL